MGNLSLTVIDSLDSLLVFGERDKFADSVRWLLANADFNKNITVSVFETSIRVVGGLLSAHLLVQDLCPKLHHSYSDELLDLGINFLRF